MRDLACRVVPVLPMLPAPAADLAGVIVRLSIDNQPYWCDGTNWIGLSGTLATESRLSVALLSSDRNSGSSSLSDVEDLSLALQANSTYSIEARIIFQSSASDNGICLSQSVPSEAMILAQWDIPTSSSSRTFSNQRAANTGSASSSIDASNTNTLASASILVKTKSSAGDLQIRFATEDSDEDVTVKAGSCLIAIKVS
jgi:hypothetical protein